MKKTAQSVGKRNIKVVAFRGVVRRNGKTITIEVKEQLYLSGADGYVPTSKNIPHTGRVAIEAFPEINGDQIYLCGYACSSSGVISDPKLAHCATKKSPTEEMAKNRYERICELMRHGGRLVASIVEYGFYGYSKQFSRTPRYRGSN